MNANERFEQELKDAWGSEPPAGQVSGCADAAVIWAAARGESAVPEVEKLVDHATTCARCADAWRLAKLLAPVGEVVHPKRNWRPFALAAAVLLTAALIAPWERLTWGPGEWRGDQQEIVSLVDEATPLARSACLLRWSEGPPGTRYRLTLSTIDGSLDRTVDDLVEPRFIVPAGDLVPLPPRAVILWRVTAILPDGDERASVTFRATLE